MLAKKKGVGVWEEPIFQVWLWDFPIIDSLENRDWGAT
ncbi:hypothetical protein FIS3754_30550 [Fischerella sp. NIES-3754]|nr:hypothetical protein FIS3754_30550 [Fischerella sp. NIES-3754]BCX09451.1 MAG: hypothetical protein KatS3mg066_3310 [Fischerella sp.]